MDWTGEPKLQRGISQRPFELQCSGRRIPGLLWAPESGAKGRPVLLLGHGANVHKRADYLVASARRAVRDWGFISVAIDGPGHGDRLDAGQEVDFEADGPVPRSLRRPSRIGRRRWTPFSPNTAPTKLRTSDSLWAP